jgi:hypothetical protein
MTVDVEYDIDDEAFTGDTTAESEVPALARGLEDVVRYGFQNGVFTGDLSAVVDEWNVKIDRLYVP